MSTIPPPRAFTPGAPRTSTRTFIAHVEDRPGVLNRIASLFRRRGYNIVSLTVGRTHDPGVSRLTVVVDADDDTARRIEANLYKLIDVRSVEEVDHAPTVARELALLKVASDAAHRGEILQLCNVVGARIADVSIGALIVEFTGTHDEVDRLVEVLRPYTIVEMVRTGVVAMSRGDANLTQENDEPWRRSTTTATLTSA
jgi:acetolactate synthase-1/3 small subunit